LSAIVCSCECDRTDSTDLSAWRRTDEGGARIAVDFSPGFEPAAITEQPWNLPELRQRYAARFTEPDLEARLLSRMVMGNIVTDLELITRNFPEGLGLLEMLCIYEVVDGRIQRASFAPGATTMLKPDAP
jgi:hypothetical protein